MPETLIIGGVVVMFVVAIASFVMLVRSLGRRRGDKRPRNPYRSSLRDPD